MARTRRRRRRFKQRGIVLATQVQHPGTKPTFFINTTRIRMRAFAIKNIGILSKTTKKSGLTEAQILKNIKVFSNKLGRFGVKAMKEELQATKTTTKRSSGELKKSLRFETEPSNLLIVTKGERNRDVARFLNDGTKPHIIKAKKGGALAFRPSKRIG